MLALAYGAGFAIAVVLLPISDIAPQAWRIAFGISALSIFLLPRLARSACERQAGTSISPEGRLGAART